MINPLFGGPVLPPDPGPAWVVPPGMATPRQCPWCQKDFPADVTAQGIRDHLWECDYRPKGLSLTPPGMVAPPLPRPDDAEAVEKIAHALFAYGWGNIRTWGEMTEKMREDVRDEARAALLALWEGKP